MKIRSLLLAASAVAMSATSANALVVAVDSTSNAGDILAAELNLSATPVNGLYEFDVTRDSGVAYSDGVSLVVTVTLPAGRTFATGNSPTITTTSGVVATGGVSAGGTAGSNTISFNITPDSGNLGINIAGLLVAAGDHLTSSSEMVVSVTNAAGGTEVDGTPAEDKTVFVPSAKAVGAITVTGGAPLVVALNSGTPSTVFNNLSAANAGDVTLAAISLPNLDATTPFNAGTDAPYVSLLTGSAAGPTGFGSGNIATTTTTINFPNGTAGFASTTLDTVPGVLGANDVVFTASGGGLIGGGLLALTGEDDDGEAAIEVQQPTVTNVAVGLTGAAFTTPVVLTATPNELKEITRAGALEGTFDWVGEAITNSVFRVTGVTPSTLIGYNVTFANTKGGQDGTFSATAMSSAAGEIVLNSFNAFGTSNAGYERGDVSLSFDGQNTAAVDVDRLLVREGIISAFGNSATQED